MFVGVQISLHRCLHVCIHSTNTHHINTLSYIHTPSGPLSQAHRLTNLHLSDMQIDLLLYLSPTVNLTTPSSMQQVNTATALSSKLFLSFSVYKCVQLHDDFLDIYTWLSYFPLLCDRWLFMLLLRDYFEGFLPSDSIKKKYPLQLYTQTTNALSHKGINADSRYINHHKIHWNNVSEAD